MENQQKQVNFAVKPDPRIKASAADYALQHQLLTGIETGVKEIHQSVSAIRKAREQINYLVELLADQPLMKSLTDSGKAVIKIITAWEDKLVQSKSQSYDDIINFENKLSADYIFLRGEADVNIPGVTDGQQEILKELDVKWAMLKAALEIVKTQHISGFNKLCEEKKLQKISFY